MTTMPRSRRPLRNHLSRWAMAILPLFVLMLAVSVPAAAVDIPGFWYIFDPATGNVVYGSGAQAPGSAFFNANPIGGVGNIDSVANTSYRQTLQMLINNAKPYPGSPTLGLTPPPGFLVGGPATGATAVVGYVGVGVAAGILVYKSGQYYYYTQQLVNNVGSEPANNLTDYENPANYWQQFWSYYGLSSDG